MLTITPRITSNIPTFKSTENLNAVDTTKRTNAGLKTGTATAGLGLACLALANHHIGGVKWGKAGISLLGIAGCGALIDALINNKFKKGEPNNSTAKKYGAPLGAAIGIIEFIRLNGKQTFTKNGVGRMAIITTIYTLGGLALGAITDHFANKTAKKGAEVAESKTK